MKADLYEMLKGSLIIPYPKEMVDQMEKLTSDYAKLNHIDNEWVAEWVIALFCKKKNEDLKQFMESQFQEQYEEQVTFPTSTINALMAYMICQAISGTYEDADPEFSSIALMNCVVLLNGRLETMPFAEYLLDGYGKLQAFMRKKTTSLNVDTSEFVDNLFSISVEKFINECCNEESYKSCKKLAIDAWKYKIIQMLEKYKDTHCSYADCYRILSDIVSSIPYRYLYVNLEKLLEYLCSSSADVTTIGNIIKELVDNGCIPQTCNCNSSILLRLITRDKDLVSLAFVNSDLSKHDFCVYLYYELLMEKITYDDGQ